jgi:hypothetical protein
MLYSADGVSNVEPVDRKGSDEDLDSVRLRVDRHIDVPCGLG